MGDQNNQKGPEGTEPQEAFYQPQRGEPNGARIGSAELDHFSDYDSYFMAQNHHAVNNMNVDFGIMSRYVLISAVKRQRRKLTSCHGKRFNMNMLNMNDAPGQAGPEVQDQNPFRSPFADQNQPGQAQFPVLDAANNNNNVPAMDFAIPEDAIDPRLRAPQDDGSAAGPDSEGLANAQFQAQRLAYDSGSRYPPQQEQRYSDPPVGPVVDNLPAGQDNHPPLDVFMSSPAASPKASTTAGLTNPVEPSSGSRRPGPFKPGRKKESVVPTESPSKKRKVSPLGHNRSQSLVQPQDHYINNGRQNPAVRDKRSATVGSSCSMHPLGQPDQSSGHFSEGTGRRVPPNTSSSCPHHGHYPVDPRPGPNRDPVPILPKPVPRRERLKNALQGLHENHMTAWRRMPSRMRFGFFKELVLSESRGERLMKWEQDLLIKSMEDEQHRAMVYQEIAMDTDRELQALLEKHRRLAHNFENAGRSIIWLRKHAVALQSIVQKNELTMQQMMSRIADLERSHLTLNQSLDERVHILNGKVDGKVQELERRLRS
ncbi:hypothetical protein QBC32DRAFT_384876 [Pseudoneurospora amorphoporcata]|uniref:Uncharacterized protein n=1 Tax=Pseudoneurospora amorphoporcata TaxID=241081 RepID=A0AAN6NK53_9PEZI|nr:hypothetical protein QBC32DRAFT_384876 [Pseudoneurospora amorphoporcata]